MRSDLMELAETDLLDQWLFNVELECSGGSLWPLEEVVIGGAVLTIPGLLRVLQYAAALRALASETPHD